MKSSVVVNLVASDRQATGELWGITSGELRRVQDHLTLLIKTARERVVAFLLEISKRMGGASSLDLPMGRQDIADYLGLTIETVSRTLAELAQGGTISLPASRRILVRDLAALEASRT